jgi:hypothetical protein
VAVASTGGRVTALREWSTDGSTFLDLISSRDSPSATCFIVDNIVFHECFIKWKNECVRVQQTDYSPKGSSRTSP